MLQQPGVKNFGKTIKLQKFGDAVTVRAGVCPYKLWGMGGESQSNLNWGAQEFHIFLPRPKKKNTAPVLSGNDSDR